MFILLRFHPPPAFLIIFRSLTPPRMFFCMNIWTCSVSKQRTRTSAFNKTNHFILVSCFLFLNQYLIEGFISQKKLSKSCFCQRLHPMGFRSMIKHRWSGSLSSTPPNRHSPKSLLETVDISFGNDQCWGKLLLKVMRYNIALLPKKVTNYFT